MASGGEFSRGSVQQGGGLSKQETEVPKLHGTPGEPKDTSSWESADSEGSPSTAAPNSGSSAAILRAQQRPASNARLLFN